MTSVYPPPLKIRWHGRGGLGAWTVSELFAKAAILDDNYIQAFPAFGPERWGAPVTAYNRISDQPIRLHCLVENPHIAVVLDHTLIKAYKNENEEGKNIWDDIPPNGILVVNTRKTPDKLPQLIKELYQSRNKPDISEVVVYTVDATGIALNILNRPITNTAMLGTTLGALKKYTDIPDEKLPCIGKRRVKDPKIPLKAFKKVVYERFPKEIAKRNMTVIQEAYKDVQSSIKYTVTV
jgi:pyruvate ferredoxin oxidoreductase gamma subunit